MSFRRNFDEMIRSILAGEIDCGEMLDWLKSEEHSFADRSHTFHAICHQFLCSMNSKLIEKQQQLLEEAAVEKNVLDDATAHLLLGGGTWGEMVQVRKFR